MTSKDLWGSIPRVEPVDSPVRVLQEQAELLKQKTKGKLVGGVATESLQNRLRTTLAVIAPDLDNYRFDL
jgi:hypothetical protein